MKKAFLFPGQGSQFIGMGKELASQFEVARDVFSEVDEALGEKLSALMFKGDIEELTLTRNAQPAIMAVSIAILRVMSFNGLDLKTIDLLAGHSLGEYSALCASEAISLRDTAIVLRKRGIAMQKAVSEGKGLMVAVLGLTSEIVNELIIKSKSDNHLIQVANDNDPSQVVISGEKKEVEKFSDFLKEKNAKRIIKLPVSAPFHSPLMKPAALTMETELGKVNFSNPIVPIIQNVDLNIQCSTEGLVDRLVKQICGTVRWRESLLKMADEYTVGLAPQIDQALEMISD